MEYSGEHLLPGKIGHFFLLLSLVSSIGATICYFLSVQKDKASQAAKWQDIGSSTAAAWKKLARIFFITQAISVFAVFATLFHIISHHYFEYKYAWQHSSLSLEPKYLLSCFWEGQEGSFLLWSAWHCLVGLFFIWREKKWEAPVMAVVSFAQLMLATMLLGDFLGMHIGANPFVLMRNSGMLDNAPAFFEADGSLRKDYLSLIRDGNDLNPLLQNYWMVIHPPVLFLGFAATIIPFAFAIAGLWTRRFTEWTKPALSWALFAAAVLGLGIMMGAKWAYESLNFGGYWAWDPVENASLVPWLILVAGIHGLVIYRHTGNALRTTFLFFILSFLFILYSTYLTRSGVLQDTSVHAFTGEGITPTHLLTLVLIFVLPALCLFVFRYRKIPAIKKEEETSSREFWMFVGSLVLFLSSMLIILMTSIPVINKLAGLPLINTVLGWFGVEGELFKPLAVGEDSEHAYNRVQIFVAIIIGILTGFAMYLKYKSTAREFIKKLFWPSLAGVVIASLVLVFGEINYDKQGYGFMAAIWIGVFAAVYAAVTNAAYIFTGFKGQIKKAGGAISHLGFALLIVGVLVSSSKKEVLSYNTSGIPVFFGKDSKENPGENLTLVKGLRTDMGKYWVTYEKDSTHPKKPYLWYYHLKFERKDGQENFTLTPDAFVNYKNNMGLMANPDARHYLTHDIFTYITSLPDPTKKDDTASFRPVALQAGDTAFYSRGFIILEELDTHTDLPKDLPQVDSAFMARLRVQSQTTSTYTIKPVLLKSGDFVYVQPDTLIQENLVLQLQKVEGNTAELGIKESDAVMQYVTLKAYKFPWINLVWGGTVIMIIGIVISMFHRREKKKLAMAREKASLQPEALEV